MREEDIKAAAVRFAEAGGAVLMRYFQRELQISAKGEANLVSEADIEAERTILELIRQTFPDHGVLAEESGASESSETELLWIVDPLDGTTNFAHRIPHFAVSVALYQRGEPHTGVVLNPSRGDLYVAQRGDGATLNGTAISVSSEGLLQDTIVGTGFYYDRGEMMRRTLRSIEALFTVGIHGIRRFGTASLDLCHVASGLYGAFFEYELAAWDFAAGRLIVEEAGGKVTDCDGQPLPLGKTSMLASNSHLHEQVLSIVQRP